MGFTSDNRSGEHSLHAETRVAFALIAAWLAGAALLSTLPIGNAPQDQTFAFSRPIDARLPAQIALEKQQIANEHEDLSTLISDNHLLAAMATSDALSLAWPKHLEPYANLPVFNADGHFLGNVCRVDMSAGGLAELHVIGPIGPYAMNLPIASLQVEHRHIALARPEPPMRSPRAGMEC